MENELNWLLLGIVDCLLEEVNVYVALVFGGGKFLYEVDKGGECGGLVAKGGVFVLVVEFGGHLAKEGGEECAYSGKVLFEELLSCGSGLLDGMDGGFGGLFNGLDTGVLDFFAVGFDGAVVFCPFKECAACYVVFSCNLAGIAGVYVVSDNEFFILVVILFLFFLLPYSFPYTLFHCVSRFYNSVVL